jgi:hypothetical protein
MKSYRAMASAIVAVSCALGGCSSVIEGTSQEILVNTNPVGADCQLVREGNVIARVATTPGGVGWAIDSSSGADNKYDGVVNLTLVPAGSVPAAAPVAPGSNEK